MPILSLPDRVAGIAGALLVLPLAAAGAPDGLPTAAVQEAPLQIAAALSPNKGDFGSNRSTLQVPVASDDSYEFGLLVDAPGVETTFYACTACHSEMIIAQQGLSRDHWRDLLDWMVEEQGMAELEEPDLTEILDYLSTHYNEDRPNFPRPLGN